MHFLINNNKDIILFTLIIYTQFLLLHQIIYIKYFNIYEKLTAFLI